MDRYGYGFGIVPPQDPVYLREFERRTREWYDEVAQESRVLRERKLHKILISLQYRTNTASD